MPVSAEQFRDHIIESGIVLDPDKVHRQFTGDMHGQKLDFDNIPDDHPLMQEWIEILEENLREIYAPRHLGKIALLGLEKGTTRLVEPLVERLGRPWTAAYTEKIGPGAREVRLTKNSVIRLQIMQPDVIIELEDASTEGTVAASAAVDVRKYGPWPIEMLTTWQRREQLEKLQALEVPYHAVIYEPLLTYKPEECLATGFCADGWKLIPYTRSD